jgi:hypothetical protein
VEEKWLFACSLERNYKKKIREDVAAVKNFGEHVDRVVFFHHLPIKIGDRNKLKKEARESGGLELEIFDGLAIAEMLSDRQCLWIAERYLSLLSEFLLVPEAPSPGWFEAIVQKKYNPDCLNSADFFELKDAVRSATWRSEHHSDLAKLLKDLRTFRIHPLLGILLSKASCDHLPGRVGFGGWFGCGRPNLLRDVFRDRSH